MKTVLLCMCIAGSNIKLIVIPVTVAKHVELEQLRVAEALGYYVSKFWTTLKQAFRSCQHISSQKFSNGRQEVRKMIMH